MTTADHLITQHELAEAANAEPSNVRVWHSRGKIEGLARAKKPVLFDPDVS